MSGSEDDDDYVVDFIGAVHAGAGPSDVGIERAVINRVEYSDGSTWTRDGWKPEKLTGDAATRAKDLRDGLCTPL